jgi:hypothetical protein
MRKALVVSGIRAFGPDLLGLQECRDDSQAGVVTRNLTGYEFVGVQGGGDDASAIGSSPSWADGFGADPFAPTSSTGLPAPAEGMTENDVFSV